jgi:glycine oxidase
MMEKRKEIVDVLVVGHGLAGATLASALEMAGKSVRVVHQSLPGEASPVASGMWNPLTFRLLLKSWRVDELLPVALDFYRAEASRLETPLLANREILRIFPDAAAELRWQERLQDPAFAPYLHAEKPPFNLPQLDLKAAQGLVKQAGWLNLNAYLEADLRLRREQNQLIEAPFSMADVHWEEDAALWQGLRAKYVLLCRGQFERHDPWFNWLPLKPAHGDVLTLRIPQLNLQQIYNAGFFILPLGKQLFRVGATYEWDELAPGPTEAGKNTLLEKFQAAYLGPFELVDHLGGIRPTVADRRPLLGFHPTQPRLGIFNGLGTKGVMIAPFFAKQWAAHLSGTGSIEDEVNIKRFRKRYEQHTGSRWNAVAL